MQESNTPPAHATDTPAANTKTQLSVTGINIAAEQQPQPIAQFRLVMISFLAAGMGLLAGDIAFLLYKLIGLFSNIAFNGRASAAFMSQRYNHLGLWVIFLPVIGGLIVRGHGQVRQVQDQGTWNSRSHGNGTGEPQPHPAASCDFETHCLERCGSHF
jgi:hypothetical protein